MPHCDNRITSAPPGALAQTQGLPVSRRLRRAFLACSWVALLAACGGGGGDNPPAAPSPSPPAPAPGPAPAPAVPLVAPGTWVVMGSSTATGAGATSQSWVDRLKAGYASRSVSVANIAKGATMSYSGLPSSSTPVAGRPAPDPAANVDAAMALAPKLVLVSYPTNDTAFGYTADETVRNLLAIRSAVQARGAAVIMLSTQPAALTAGQLALLPQIDSRVSAEAGSCFVAVREALAAPDGTLHPAYDSGDGLHPNEAGHALIHSRVASVIDSGLCVRTQ